MLKLQSQQELQQEKQKASACAYRGNPIFHNASVVASSCVWASRGALLRKSSNYVADAAFDARPILAVAICLSGEPRSFMNPRYPKHFKAAFLDPLKSNETI
jgi:hypothetical protein